MVIATDRTEGDVVVGGVGGDLGESGWWVVRIESSVGVRWSGDRGWYWPGGGQGGRPLEGIASPGVGRIRQARMNF